MMIPPHSILLLFIVLHFTHSHSLNRDGVLLLTFKYTITSDPLSALSSWTYDADETPCSWHGVTCSNSSSLSLGGRVIGISLPSSQLMGYLSPYLGYLEQLQSLNLSSNSLNGSIPPELLRSSALRVLDLSNNLLSGELPGELFAGLQILNLADNAFSGELPSSLISRSNNNNNLSEVSLRGNYLSGQLWSGGVNRQVRILDLSSNLINGSLPPDFGGQSLIYLNVSFNRITGEIPPDFAKEIPENATLDFSYNHLSGEIPPSLLVNPRRSSFSGNDNLCGKPLRNLCFAVVSPALSPAAIAAKPRMFDSTPMTTNVKEESRSAGLRPGTIAVIIAADLAGIMIIALVVVLILRRRKSRAESVSPGQQQQQKKKRPEVMLSTGTAGHIDSTWSSPASSSSSSSSSCRTTTTTTTTVSKCCLLCLRSKNRDDDVEEEEDYSETGSEIHDSENRALNNNNHGSGGGGGGGGGGSSRDQLQQGHQGKLLTLDGGVELELEPLLKASAYILGASGPNILYKAVLEDGSALAVRRIGGRAAEFEGHVRMVAKVVANHPNLVRIRGFYLGPEEKLIIYEFLPNGSLATARHHHRKVGGGNNSSPGGRHSYYYNLPWDTRLTIAKGVARGLCYLHDKKHVHGNIKPTNILLGPDTQPKIADFGLDRFIALAPSSHRDAAGSTRHFGSRRSTASRESFPETNFGGGASPSSSYAGWFSPYHPPESLRALKPNSKWDVYSFGILLIELLTGKLLGPDDLAPWMAQLQSLPQERAARVLRMADAPIRPELEGKEDALFACFNLACTCVAPQPEKRPSMKHALQLLHTLQFQQLSL